MASDATLRRTEGAAKNTPMHIYSASTSNCGQSRDDNRTRNSLARDTTHGAGLVTEGCRQQANGGEKQSAVVATPPTLSLHPAAHSRLVDDKMGGCSLFCRPGARNSFARRVKRFFTRRKKKEEEPQICRAADMTTSSAGVKMTEGRSQSLSAGADLSGRQEVAAEHDKVLEREQAENAAQLCRQNEGQQPDLSRKSREEQEDDEENEDLSPERFVMAMRRRNSDDDSSSDGGPSTKDVQLNLEGGHEEEGDSGMFVRNFLPLSENLQTPLDVLRPDVHDSDSSGDESVSLSFHLGNEERDGGVSSVSHTLQSRVEACDAEADASAVAGSRWPSRQKVAVGRATTASEASSSIRMMPLTRSHLDRWFSGSDGKNGRDCSTRHTDHSTDKSAPVNAKTVSAHLFGDRDRDRNGGGGGGGGGGYARKADQRRVNSRIGATCKTNDIANKRNKRHRQRDLHHERRAIPSASRPVGAPSRYAKTQRIGREKVSTPHNVSAGAAAPAVSSSSLDVFSSTLGAQQKGRQQKRGPSVARKAAEEGDRAAAVAGGSLPSDGMSTARSLGSSRGAVGSYAQLAARRREYLQGARGNGKNDVNRGRSGGSEMKCATGEARPLTRDVLYDIISMMRKPQCPSFHPLDHNAAGASPATVCCSRTPYCPPFSTLTWREFKEHFYLDNGVAPRDAESQNGCNREPIEASDEEYAHLAALAASLRPSCTACGPDAYQLFLLAPLLPSRRERMLFRFSSRESLYETPSRKRRVVDAASAQSIPTSPATTTTTTAAAAGGGGGDYDSATISSVPSLIADSRNTNVECREHSVGGATRSPSPNCTPDDLPHEVAPLAAGSASNNVAVNPVRMNESDAMIACRFPRLLGDSEQRSLDAGFQSGRSGGNKNSMSGTNVTPSARHALPLSSSDARSDATCMQQLGSVGSSGVAHVSQSTEKHVALNHNSDNDDYYNSDDAHAIRMDEERRL